MGTILGSYLEFPEQTVDTPDQEVVEAWLWEKDGCEATDGCWVWYTGWCEHGHPAWTLRLGYDPANYGIRVVDV